MSLNERLAQIETLLFPDEEISQWSYEELRTIIDKTDLRPEMDNQGLLNVGPLLTRIEERLEELGHTDAHHGEQTLEERLNMIEGSISILCGAHLGHTNSDAGEFKGMHGFGPSQIRGDLLQKVEDMQKKLDRLLFLHKDETFTISAETAMKM